MTTASIATVTACTAATLYFFYKYYQSAITNAERLTALLAAERKGRTKAERHLAAFKRELQVTCNSVTNNNKLSLPVYTFCPIAFARTLFVDRRGCPRQGSLTPSVCGWLDICKHIPRASFESLEQFSHIWVTFVFDKNTNIHKAGATERTFKAKIRPPLLGGKKVGLFATRSPHRPNPVGLTLCKLNKVDLLTGRIYLSGIDLCDGTAVLDIKPYVCHDRPADIALKYASWIPSKEQSKSKPLKVIFTIGASNQLQELLPILHKTSKSNQLYYPDAASTEQCITEVLKLDIRGSTQKRGEDGKGLYLCRLGVINVEFRVKDGVAIVESITKSTDDDTRMKQVSYTR
jgi:tRNA-Thr(GGU) m(6)t(6)A37 methyltransferase TsaA